MKKCALWSCNNDYLFYTFVSITSFIKANDWFVQENNDIIIVMSDPVIDKMINDAHKIYKNIIFEFLPFDNTNKWYNLEITFREHIGEHALHNNRHKVFFCMFNRFLCLDILQKYEFVMQVETDILFNKSVQCLFNKNTPILNCQMFSDITEGLLVNHNNLIIPHTELHKISDGKKPIFGQLGLTVFHNSIYNELNYDIMLNIVNNNSFGWINNTNYDEECFNICCNILNLHDKYFYINVKYINIIDNNGQLSSTDDIVKDVEPLFIHYITKPWFNNEIKYYNDWLNVSNLTNYLLRD